MQINNGNIKNIVQNMVMRNSNPMMKNLYGMLNGNPKGIENFARNICDSKGINFDEAFPKFMSQFKNR